MAARKSSSTRRASRGKPPSSRSGRASSTKRGATRRATGARRSRPAAAPRARGGRRYGARASEDVGQAMHEMKHGQLKSGRSGRRVTNPKQAIAIGLSKARREGARVPPKPARPRARRGRR